MSDEIKIQSPFPAPPPFWKHFTKENTSELRRLRKAAGVSQEPVNDSIDDTQPGLDLLALPAGLRYLIPPPPPAQGKYTSFGVQHDLHAPEPTLKDAGIDVLVPDDSTIKHNPQPYLIRMAQSLLTTFLSLTGILAQNPELQEEKIKDLQTIVYNMHDLINQYRPHQARETLVLMMEERLEQLRNEIRQIGEAKEKVRTLLETLQEEAGRAGQERSEDKLQENGSPDGKEELQRKDRQRAIWAALDHDLGSPGHSDRPD